MISNPKNMGLILTKEELNVLLEKNRLEQEQIERIIAPKLKRIEELKKRSNQYRAELMRIDPLTNFKVEPIILDPIDGEKRVFDDKWSWFLKAEYILEDFAGGLTVNEILQALSKYEIIADYETARVGITNALNRRVGVDVERLRLANKGYTYAIKKKAA